MSVCSRDVVTRESLAWKQALRTEFGLKCDKRFYCSYCSLVSMETTELKQQVLPLVKSLYESNLHSKSDAFGYNHVNGCKHERTLKRVMFTFPFFDHSCVLNTKTAHLDTTLTYAKPHEKSKCVSFNPSWLMLLYGNQVNMLILNSIARTLREVCKCRSVFRGPCVTH